MSKIKLVVFDMAGTTVDEDNVVYKTVQKSIADAGFEFTLEEVLEHGAGKEKHQAIKDVLASKSISDADSEAIFTKFKAGLDDAYAKLEVASFDGVPELINTLRERGVKIALDTGYNSRIANMLLAKMGWEKGREYDTLITADDVVNGRPHPDMIQLCMKNTGVANSAAVLKAGDSIIDIEEGKNAGCGITVGVTTGAQTREQLATANPTLILDKLADILLHI
jgi:phosphonatase-like hydrolase